jgi:hypothetical protein
VVFQLALDGKLGAQESRSKLGNEFFAGVGFAAEWCLLFDTAQA